MILLQHPYTCGRSQWQEEEEGNAETVQNDRASHEPSTEDVEPCIRENREDVQVSASVSSNVTPMREVNDGGRRASNIVTREKSTYAQSIGASGVPIH